MSKILVIPLDREGISPRPISPRFRSQLCYFIASTGSPGAPRSARMSSGSTAARSSPGSTTAYFTSSLRSTRPT